MADSSTRTTRLSGEMDERYEEYRDGQDMTDAEALRTLIRAGLESETEDDDQDPTRSEDAVLQLASALASGSLFVLLFGAAGVVPFWIAAQISTVGVVLAVALLVLAWGTDLFPRAAASLPGSSTSDSVGTAEEVAD